MSALALVFVWCVLCVRRVMSSEWRGETETKAARGVRWRRVDLESAECVIIHAVWAGPIVAEMDRNNAAMSTSDAIAAETLSSEEG